MDTEVLSPKLDIIFKKLFTENSDLLESVIASLLNLDESEVQIVAYLSPEIVPESAEAKFCHLDLNVKLQGQLVNLEIQLQRDLSYRERALFYWAKLYTSELKSGQPYAQLKKTISIHLLDFNLFAHERYHTEVAAVELESGDIFSDKFNLHFFEFKKALNISHPNSMMEVWLQFFNTNSKEQYIMMEHSPNPPISKAARVMLDYSDDERLREIARLREKALHDEASLLQSARLEGLREGEQIGRREGEQIGRRKGEQIGRRDGLREGEQIGRRETQETMLENAAKIFAEMGFSAEQIKENLERLKV